MDKVLLYFALKYQGNWDKIYEALDKKEKIKAEDLATIENKINCKYLTIINPLYPNKLKNSYKPPFILFYQGDINLLINYFKIVGLVQETTISDYSLQQTKKILKELNKENKTILTLGFTDSETCEIDHQIFITNQMKEIKIKENQLAISESFEESTINNQERLLFAISS
jgi:DNA processing protein